VSTSQSNSGARLVGVWIQVCKRTGHAERVLPEEVPVRHGESTPSHHYYRIASTHFCGVPLEQLARSKCLEAALRCAKLNDSLSRRGRS